MAAAAAGVLTLGEVRLDDVAAVQPLQVKRISSLFGRLSGRVLAAHPVPRYCGFGLTRRAIAAPRLNLGAMKGTLSRALRHRVAARTGRSVD